MPTVRIKGMSCQHCVASTKEALENLPGVSNVEVDLDKGEARYEGEVEEKTIREAIAKIGFEVVS